MLLTAPSGEEPQFDCCWLNLKAEAFLQFLLLSPEGHRQADSWCCFKLHSVIIGVIYLLGTLKPECSLFLPSFHYIWSLQLSSAH